MYNATAGGRGPWNLDGSVVWLMLHYNQTHLPKYGDVVFAIMSFLRALVLTYTENGSRHNNVHVVLVLGNLCAQLDSHTSGHFSSILAVIKTWK